MLERVLERRYPFLHFSTSQPPNNTHLFSTAFSTPSTNTLTNTPATQSSTPSKSTPSFNTLNQHPSHSINTLNQHPFQHPRPTPSTNDQHSQSTPSNPAPSFRYPSPSITPLQSAPFFDALCNIPTNHPLFQSRRLHPTFIAVTFQLYTSF